MVGHSGDRVHFQKPEFTLAVLHDVYPAPGAAAQHPERIQRQMLELQFAVRVQSARDLVSGVIGQILGVVIVENVIRAQTNGRQCLILQETDGKFRAFNPLLNENQRIQYGRLRISLNQLLLIVHLTNANAGAFPRGLYAQRQRQRLQ